MDKHGEKEKERKLTKAEQKRKVAFEQLKEQLEEQGYRERDLTVGLVYANIMAIVLGLPFIILFFAAFFWRNETFVISLDIMPVLLYLALFFVLVFLHELIHGVTWAIFAPSHWKAVSFGFVVEYLTPYCTCNEPLKRWQYVIGALMPTVILGLIPSLTAVYTGSVLLLLLGMMLIWGGGGDMTIVLRLLRYRDPARDTVYIDHPYQAGVVAFERK